MSQLYSTSWSSWHDLPERERTIAVHDCDFWQKLSETQQKTFLAEADWQEIRLNPDARKDYLDSLLTAAEIKQRLELDSTQLRFLMSTRKMPGALVGGAWKYDWLKVQRWLAAMGGLTAMHEDVNEQIRKHREGQQV